MLLSSRPLRARHLLWLSWFLRRPWQPPWPRIRRPILPGYLPKPCTATARAGRRHRCPWWRCHHLCPARSHFRHV